MNPELYTERLMIQNVVARWHQTYSRLGKDYMLSGGRLATDIENELRSLDLDTATAEEVAEIIDSTSWTNLRCHQCRKLVKAIVRVGQPLEHDSSTADLCEDCVYAALCVITGRDRIQ